MSFSTSFITVSFPTFHTAILPPISTNTTKCPRGVLSLFHSRLSIYIRGKSRFVQEICQCFACCKEFAYVWCGFMLLSGSYGYSRSQTQGHNDFASYSGKRHGYRGRKVLSGLGI